MKVEHSAETHEKHEDKSHKKNEKSEEVLTSDQNKDNVVSLKDKPEENKVDETVKNAEAVVDNMRSRKMLLMAIVSASQVRVALKFGNTDSYVKLSKTEARNIVEALPATGSANDLGFSNGRFGQLIDGVLFLGM